MKLEDKIAIVTGAGRGIGREIALAFACEGADVVAVSRTLSEVEEICAQARALGRKALPLKVDVSRKEDVDGMVNAALARFGRVDILVNNAGVLGPVGPLYENDINAWVETIHVNLVGTFLCCRAVIPVMIKQRRGKIINLSGGGAAYPKPMFSAYACSKTAVVRLTETLAEEVKDYNIQVNAIAPGTVKTRMVEQIAAAGEKAGKTALTEAKRVLENASVGFEPVTDLAVFLASEDSEGLTGRLLSAVWDDWRSLSLESRVRDVIERGLFTLRRIDGAFFYPLGKDIPRR